MGSTHASVAIVGAGIAGLAAAARLQQQGFAVTILEARPRAGGRIDTRRDLAPCPLERGAEFVHGAHPGLLERIEQAGLHRDPRPFEPLILQDGKASAPGWSWEKIFAEIANPDAADLPIAVRIGELLRGGDWSEDDARRLRRYVEGYMAADVERVSARALSQETRATEAIDGDEGNTSIREGYDALVQSMAGGLDAGTLRLETVVRRIRWSRGSVVLDLQRAGGGELPSVEASCAIVTIPLALLQLPEDHAGAIRFEPRIPAVLTAARRLETGNVVKSFFHFRCALSEIPGLSDELRRELGRARFLQTPNAKIPTWWQSGDLHAPLLIGWAGGPTARKLAGKSSQEITKAGVETLSHALDVPEATLASCIAATEIADWDADPWARGAYSWIPAGALDAPALLATPVEGTLFFAGEATDTSGYRGTVHGALDTGLRAAGQVIASSNP